MQHGKCSNFGNCDKADSKEIITIPDGAEMICPICSHRLTPLVQEKQGGSPIVPLISILLILRTGYRRRFLGS